MSNNNNKMSRKVAIVTGSSSGIGRTTAIALRLLQKVLLRQAT